MQSELNNASITLSLDTKHVCSCVKLFQYYVKYLYSYFSIVFSNCIVILGRSFNGVKLFQYAINNLYSNSRIRQDQTIFKKALYIYSRSTQKQSKYSKKHSKARIKHSKAVKSTYKVLTKPAFFNKFRTYSRNFMLK